MKINVIAIVTLVALLSIFTGVVTAAEIVIHPTPTFDPLSDRGLSEEPDDGIEIENVTVKLEYWNARLQWNLSQEQITQYSSNADVTLLNNYPTSDGKWFHIKNLTKFDEEFGRYIGLNNDQISRFILQDQKQLIIDRQNYHSPFLQSNTVLAGSDISITDYVLTSVSPGSQSAPYAIGNLYYLYIFTDFTSPGPYGSWVQSHIDDALSDAGEGTWQIMDQAPAVINVNNDGGWARVTVNGENLGPNVASTWGQNGWMEQAASQFGHGTDTDGRYTTKLAKYMKSISGADSVILVFFTHDDKGATATGPDQGYADKVLVSYWGVSQGQVFDSQAGSYEHEIVHAYGALDEYIGGNGVDCNYGPSRLAVSPMYEMYKNTNYDTCPSSTKRGVMYYPYNNGPFWYEISSSSRKFIGWGDFDGDGMVDPLDSDPYNPPLPVAGFAASTRSGTAPLVDEFFDQSYNANAWAWDFENDGIIDSTVQNPVHTYSTGGTYTVKLTATNAWGSDDEIKNGYIVVNGLAVRPLPGQANPPTDPDHDGLYEDMNGNGVKDMNDVVLFFKNLIWIRDNEPIACFDFNGNGSIDTNDVVRLFREM
jgi:PKD repeat protein